MYLPCPPLADVPMAPPAPSASELGTWVFVFAALAGLVYCILGIMTQIRLLTKKHVSPADRYITKRELQEQMTTTEGKITAVNKDVRDLTEYTHKSVHDLRDGIHSLQIRIEAIRVQIHDEVLQVIRPLEAKIDQTTLSLARALTILEGLDGKGNGLSMSKSKQLPIP